MSGIVARFKALKKGDNVILNTVPPRLVEITKTGKTAVYSGDMGFDLFTGHAINRRHTNMKITLLTPESQAQFEKDVMMYKVNEWRDVTWRKYTGDSKVPVPLVNAILAHAPNFMQEALKSHLYRLHGDEALAVYKAMGEK